MSNPAINWIKEHPAIAGSVAAGIGLIVYLMSRSSSGGGSFTSSVAQAQTANAALATQNAQIQAQVQAATISAQYAAQVENNKNETALAATVAQFNAQQNVAQLAADVQNNQTNKQADVASQLINAETETQKAQIDAESKVYSDNFAYLTEFNDKQAELAKMVIPGAVKNLDNASNISANATNILDSIFGAQSSANAASQAEAIKQSSNAYKDASITNSIVSGASSIFKNLFA
jgi:hypothetical protein